MVYYVITNKEDSNRIFDGHLKLNKEMTYIELANEDYNKACLYESIDSAMLIFDILTELITSDITIMEINLEDDTLSLDYERDRRLYNILEDERNYIFKGRELCVKGFAVAVQVVDILTTINPSIDYLVSRV